jgi:hypothetical protein
MEDINIGGILMVIFYIMSIFCWIGIAVIKYTVGLEECMNVALFLVIAAGTAFMFGIISSFFIDE